MGYPGVCSTISLRTHRVPGALMNFSAVPRRPHGVPTALLLELRLTVFVLSLSKKKRRPLTCQDFPRRSMEFPSRCYGVGGVCSALTSAFFIFVERRESVAGTPPGCDRGFNIAENNINYSRIRDRPLDPKL